MTYWPLAQLLCDPAFLEDLDAVDMAHADYLATGERQEFKSDLQPSDILRLYSGVDTATLREKAELVRPGADIALGPYAPVSEVRGYDSLIDEDWTGADADAFAEHVEGEGALDSTFSQLRVQAQIAYDSFIALADKFDEACEELLDFCKENVVGFADEYSTAKALGRAAAEGGVAALAGAAGGAGIGSFGGAPGALIGAIVGAISTFIITFTYEVIKLDEEMFQAGADLMQALDGNSYAGVGRDFTPRGSEPVAF